jgi:hypothetical protein
VRSTPPQTSEAFASSSSGRSRQGLYSEMLEWGLSAGTVVNMHLDLTQALGQAERWSLITVPEG